MLKKVLHQAVEAIQRQIRQKIPNKVPVMASVEVAEMAVKDESLPKEEKVKTVEPVPEKRPLESDNAATEPNTKKAKADNDGIYVPFKKKKMVLFLVYSGKDYMGMQRNPGVRTIESDLNEALLKAGVVNEEHAANPGAKMHFQRAARTDKGVSAAGQLCSLNMFVDVDDPKEKINSHLVEQIRVIGIQKVTKKFDSKNAADARTYIYMLPTFAFTPYEKFVLDNFKITDEIHQRVNEVLALFKGTHNFHNFTSGKKPNDPSARRYIIDFSMGPPFDKDGVQFAVIKVKGQSFMLHQIRKMIGLTIAIVRGLTDTDAIDRAYSNNKCDVPKAPGLGLVLDRVHYDCYNKRYGRDGFHEPILWEKYEKEIEDFKNKYIFPTIVETEKEERSMLKWLSTLHMHNFEEFLDPAQNYARTGMAKAGLNLQKDNKRRRRTSSGSTSSDPSEDVKCGAGTGTTKGDLALGSMGQDTAHDKQEKRDDVCTKSMSPTAITGCETVSSPEVQGSQCSGDPACPLVTEPDSTPGETQNGYTTEPVKEKQQPDDESAQVLTDAVKSS